MTHIFLIRHGQASFGAENYDQLSERGRKQAQRLGQHLKQSLTSAPLVVSGSMQRHQDTAALSLAESFPDVDVLLEPNWNEFDHQQIFARYDQRLSSPADLKAVMALSPDPQRELAQVFYAAMQRWSLPEYRHDYDECWHTFNRRIQGATQALIEQVKQKKPENVLVYSSGGVISNVIGQILQLSPDKSFELNWAISNCSISHIKFDHTLNQRALKLMSMNEHHFLNTTDVKLASWI